MSTEKLGKFLDAFLGSDEENSKDSFHLHIRDRMKSIIYPETNTEEKKEEVSTDETND